MTSGISSSLIHMPSPTVDSCSCVCLRISRNFTPVPREGGLLHLSGRHSLIDGIMRASDVLIRERRASWCADTAMLAGTALTLFMVCARVFIAECDPISAGGARWSADTCMWARIAQSLFVVWCSSVHCRLGPFAGPRHSMWYGLLDGEKFVAKMFKQSSNMCPRVSDDI